MRFIFSILFVFTTLTYFAWSAADERELYDEISNHGELSKLGQVCPSTLIQPEDMPFENLTSICEIDGTYCLKRCLENSSNHCFGLANHFNVTDENSEVYSRSLYSKSCQLGLASACTNAAAGIKHNDGLNQANCYTETFSKTCALDDPWGCTMYAVSLIYAEGVDKDLDKALSVMRKSCRFGDTDPACSGAIELATQILKGDFD